MEGFLYSLGLKGSIPKYVASLAAGGFRSPDDLLLEVSYFFINVDYLSLGTFNGGISKSWNHR